MLNRNIREHSKCVPYIRAHRLAKSWVQSPAAL
nr:MAG TPA: hypothetical protein [Caudoviricetes sp.]